MNYKLDFSNENKLDKENRCKLFLFLITRDRQETAKHLEGLKDMTIGERMDKCEKYFKGTNSDLPKETVLYLELMKIESNNLYKRFLKMVSDFGLTKVDLY